MYILLNSYGAVNESSPSSVQDTYGSKSSHGSHRLCTARPSSSEIGTRSWPQSALGEIWLGTRDSERSSSTPWSQRLELGCTAMASAWGRDGGALLNATVVLWCILLHEDERRGGALVYCEGTMVFPLIRRRGAGRSAVALELLLGIGVPLFGLSAEC
jgi:hypothetical protein